MVQLRAPVPVPDENGSDRMTGITVRELREALADMSDDMVVVLSSDGEGNGFSPLGEVDESMYLAEGDHYGETYPTPEAVADPHNQFTEDDEAPAGAERVVTLWPMS